MTSNAFGEDTKQKGSVMEPFLLCDTFGLRHQGKVLCCRLRGNVLSDGLGRVTGRGSLDGVLACHCQLCCKRNRQGCTVLAEQRRVNGQRHHIGTAS